MTHHHHTPSHTSSCSYTYMALFAPIHSSSAEAEITASSPALATAAAASPTQPPALAIASRIHSPTHSNTHASSTFMPSSSHSSTTSLQNIHAWKFKSSCDNNFQGFVMRVGLALVLETPKEINTLLKQTKWDKDYFGKDLYIHLANKDVHLMALCQQSPSNNGIGKN